MATRRKSKKSRLSGPVRVLIECSPHRSTGGGSIEGLTLEWDAQYESPHESNTLATLPLCHDVLSVESQASKQPCGDEGHHIPDFTVKTSFLSRKLHLEVKAIASLVRKDSLEKYRLVGKAYYERGEPFAFLTDAQLEESPRFGAVRLLTRYVTSVVAETVLGRAKAVLADGPLPIPELKAKASLELVDVYTLIARRHLTFDWTTPLSQDTVVSLPDQPFEGLKLANILRATRFGPLLAELALGRGPTDQQLLADAKTWRQSRRPLGPFQFVGGFADGKPLCDLPDEKRIPRAPQHRRAHAPGTPNFRARGAS
jgi:hypothetical protein